MHQICINLRKIYTKSGIFYPIIIVQSAEFEEICKKLLHIYSIGAKISAYQN